MENVQLLPWPAHSLDLSPIENVWSMIAERLDRHHTPVITVDDLWHRVEASWESVPVHAIQSLFESMPSVENSSSTSAQNSKSDLLQNCLLFRHWISSSAVESTSEVF
ncbi:hypothetical protein TNCV_736771 [Trichonephila clavipes]|nr:hypothetical protein TNCV_736771 [Trichonephila clavipes]